MPRPTSLLAWFRVWAGGSWSGLLAFALVLGLGLAWPGTARADNDWLGIAVPRPLDQGLFSVNEKITEVENQYWEDGPYSSHGWFLYDANGNKDAQDLLTLDTRLDWRVEPRLVLELDVPTVFSEFSALSDGVIQYYDVNTPFVEESQGLGDLRLGLRGAWRDRAEGFNAGWNLSLVAPTGLSPWAAPESLAATGDGRWQVLPGVVLGGISGAWEGWLQVVGRFEAGQTAQSSSSDYISWNSQGGVSLPAGGIWLGPRLGGDAVAGLAWIWYRDQASRLGLAVEAKGHWLSPWSVDGQGLGLPDESYFVLTPELQARYGRFSALAGWQAAYVSAVEVPASYFGAIIFDVAYTF